MKNQYIVFGIRAVIETIKAGKEIDKVLIKKGTSGQLFYELNTLLTKYNITRQYVPVQRLDRITHKNHQGVVAYISPVIYQDIEEIIQSVFEQGRDPLVILLDGITDVRNLGAIARTAECAGVDALLIPRKKTAQINADAIKTSAGALNHIPICRVASIKNTLEFIKNSGLQIIAASEKANNTYFEQNFIPPTLIVMGAEDKGISKTAEAYCDKSVNIPLKGKIDSLNVSVAAAILLYEALRQRTFPA